MGGGGWAVWAVWVGVGHALELLNSHDTTPDLGNQYLFSHA